MGMTMLQQHDSKTRLLDATLKVVRAKGYSAARIEDVCGEAGLTKGSFFHHFKGKDDLALEAVKHWDTRTTEFFAGAPYHAPTDPLDRVLAYVAFRKAILSGELPEYTCFLGTIIQEAYLTHPDISAACEKSLSAHAKTLQADIREAMRTYRVRDNWTAESLALHIQAVIQGGFILAKAKASAAAAADGLDHLRRYLELLFGRQARRGPARSGGKAKNRRKES
jgi:TetR/AcrR family transcriptional regulator, transcriptional repressor for nem operon